MVYNDIKLFFYGDDNEVSNFQSNERPTISTLFLQIAPKIILKLLSSNKWITNSLTVQGPLKFQKYTSIIIISYHVT